MKKRIVLFLVIAVLTGLLTTLTNASKSFNADTTRPGIKTAPPEFHPAQKSSVKAALHFGDFPLYFISNRGQVDKKAQFYARASRYTLWLTKEGFVFDSTKKENPKAPGGGALITASRHPSPGGNPHAGFDSTVREAQITPHHSSLITHNSAPRISRDVSRLLFVGAHKNPEILSFQKANHRVNYFKGRDKSNWRSNIPTSLAVLYKNLYKNIDLKVYGKEKQIEYDWIVKPGGSPAGIRFQYKGVKETRIDKDGNLLVETAFGQLKHKKPVSYQVIKAKSETGKKADRQAGEGPGRQEGIEAERQEVDVRFKKLGENTYGFQVGEYDKSRELIIDPLVLPYSTYFGGGSEDRCEALAVDNSGSVYITGFTSSSDFPLLNQYQGYIGGGYSDHDVFVSRIDTNQSGAAGLVYSTYLGGNDDEEAQGIALDGSGYVYVTGWTGSADFPTVGQYQPDQGGVDAFLTKLDTNQSGAASLIYSTYIGGTNSDFGYALTVDSSGSAYVAGTTHSTNFPLLNQYQSTGDIFVSKIDTTQAGSAGLLYSTRFGGSNCEYCWGIAADDSGTAYITGETWSDDFPLLNQYQGFQGQQGPYAQIDAFVSKIDTTQSGAASLLYSTCLGGTEYDHAFAIAVDNSGNAYVTGSTGSVNFPTLNQYQTFQGIHDSFLTKLDTTQSGAASLVYSTCIGGANGGDSASGITIDGSGAATIIGSSNSSDFPLLDEYQGLQGLYDAFVTRINTNLSGSAGLVFSTFCGGSDNDYGAGLAVDSSENIYIIGQTYSVDYPTFNQYQADPGDDNTDVFVTKLSMSSLVLFSPNGGEAWALGSTHPITWGVTGVSGDLKITLWKDGVLVGKIATDVDPAAGSYAWTVGDYIGGTVPVGSGYTIKIREKGTEVVDISEAPFTISAMTLLSPNGGETLGHGSIYPITWEAQTITEDLKITLWKDGLLVGKIATDVDPAAGSYAWTVGDYIGGTAPAGSGYTIKIRERGAAVSDTSDAPFVIKGVITVTYPNGGEVWATGTTPDITWTTSGVTGKLKIVLWKDGHIDEVLDNDVDPVIGTYSWFIYKYAGYQGTGYQIKIREVGTTVVDTSDAAFTINGIMIYMPQGGESWQIGSTYTISWNAHTTNNLKITLWKAGALLGVIADNVDPAAGAYDWTAGQYIGGTAVPGNDYKIKIEEIGTAVFDESRTPFVLRD